MASAGRGGDRPGYVRRVIRIPRAVVRVPGQHNITISLQPLRAQGQGGQLVIPVRVSQQAGVVPEAELQEQEEATRRAAEESHRKAQLRRALSITQPPLAEYSREEGVVQVSWQPVVAGGDEVEYTLNGWKDGAGDPITLYRGQLTSCVITAETLCRGHSHQVAVCASAAGEIGEQSPRSEVEVPALPPDQPLPPKIFSRTKNMLGLRWNPPPSNGSIISEYSLEWDQSIGQFVEIFSGKGKQFKFNHKFQPGSHTHFRVRARNAIGWSDYSEETTHSVGQAVPAAPTSPSLSSHTSHSLTLSWSTPSGLAPVSSFCLEMDDPNSGYGFCPVYQGDGLSYVCRNLQRMTGYSFRLSATNEAGTSPTSPPISYTTLPEPPGHPGNVLLHDRPHSTFLHLEWSPPSDDGGSSIESYILQVNDGMGGPLMDVYKGSEVNFLLGSLTPGQNYRCHVCAVSSGGQGAWSNEAVFQTPPTLPCPPNDLHVVGKATQTSTLLSWSRPSSDGGSAVTCYEIQCRRQEEEWVTAGTEPHSSPTSSLTFTLTHLTPGTQYTARVGCRNTVGPSEWSECTTLSTAPGPPSTPHGHSVTLVTAHSAQLQWMASMEFGSTLMGYEVEWGAVGGAIHTKLLPPSPCVVSLSHLTSDTEHTARVKAVSEAGHSDWSPFVTFTTSPSTPSPPSHLALVSSTPNNLLVAWSVPPSSGSSLTHYHIHLVPPPSPDSAHLILPPTETQATLAGLQPHTQYMIRVQAENSVGLGPLSSPLTACTLPPPPLPPSFCLISAMATSLKVSWGKRSTSKSITYILQLATDSGRFYTVYTGSATTHKLQRLKPSTHYSLRIAASSESGQGVWSDHMTYETLPPEPSVPLDLSMQQKDDVIVMSWSEVNYTAPLIYELQLKIGSQDFTQVYRGPSTSYTHPIVSYTYHQARVRACTSCLANNRKEQLFSAFTPVASYDCIQPPAPSLPAKCSDTEPAKTRGAEDGVQLQHNWLLILFGGVSLLVIVIAIILGQLLVA